MKLRTSFFNLTILKKDIIRFAPVWALYAIFLLLINTESDYLLPMQLSGTFRSLVWINCIYGGICAVVLFGDLFKSRMCNALHAMPLRREGWFITHTIAGFLFSFVPNALTALVLAVLMGQFWYLALIWIAIMTLQFLFFFGVGVFSAMCAGNRLAGTAVYGIINLLSMLVYVLVDQFYEPLLYGIRLDTSLYEYFCPLISMATADYISFFGDPVREMGQALSAHIEAFHTGEWRYLSIVAALGIGFLAGALALYRKRQLETAGDFIAWKPLKPVFHVIYTLGVGVFLYGVCELFGFGGAYLFMAVGIIVGFFTGKMLLERTVKVFQPKNILAFFLFAAVFGGSLLVTWMDPFGITRQLPNTEDIAYARLFCDEDSYLYLDPDSSCLQAESAEEIEQIRNIHQTLLNEHSDSTGYAVPIDIHYQLKDGSTLTRYYYAKSLSDVYEPVVNHLSSPEYLFSPEGVQILPGVVTGVYFDMSNKATGEYYSQSITDPDAIHSLVDAIIADCEAGHMAQHHTVNIGDYQIAWLTLDLNTCLFSAPVDGMRSESVVYLSINTSCANTVKALEEIIQQLEQEENY